MMSPEKPPEPAQTPVLLFIGPAMMALIWEYEAEHVTYMLGSTLVISVFALGGNVINRLIGTDDSSARYYLRTVS